MASEIAKKVAGTFIVDSLPVMSDVLVWLTQECREGHLKSAVERFCREQDEMLDPNMVIVESVTNERIHCKVPCRLCDHESNSTFLSEVKFTLDPNRQSSRRILI